ncbi:MAG TPA: hypothetical protein VM261_23445 [Kofleriaceae bacterium]|nr:hypothetical protein [Kofleriaceae bacterium]
MIRIGVSALVALGLVAASACSKADPRPTDTAPPAATRGGGGGGEGGAKGGAGGGGVAIQVAGAPGGGAEGAGGGAGGGGESGANDTSFKLTTEQAAPTKAGGEAVARLVVKPGAGYHMNKDFPTKLTLEPPAGVTLSKAVLEPADAEKFDDNELAFAVKMTPAGVGEYTINGTFKFAVCTDTTCDPKKQKVALVLKAN